MNSPKVSIITVVYNDAPNIERCIRNTLLQTYRNIELVVVDGGSTDGTADIIKRYDKHIIWVSEKDNGLYDAMNKGTQMATGDWVLFRNCGDFFFNEYVVEKVFNNYEDHGESFILGNERYFRHWGFKDMKPCILRNSFYQCMPVCHPATFVRRTLQLENPFNINYRNSADYDFFIKTFEKGATYKYYDMLFSIFDANTGTSTDHFDRSLKENIQILESYHSPKEYIEAFKNHLEKLTVQYKRNKNPLYRWARLVCSYYRQNWNLTWYDACIREVIMLDSTGIIKR